MAGGLTVTIGGDRSPLKRELASTVAEAKRAGLEIQNALRAKISGLERRAKGVDPDSDGGIQLANEIARKKTALSELQHRQTYREHLERLKFTKQEADAEKQRYLDSASQSERPVNDRGGGNSEAYEDLASQRRAAIAENERYQATLEANAQGLRTVTDANQAENSALEQQSSKLRDMIAARAELNRYLNSPTQQQRSPNMRAENAADDEVWQKKFAELKKAKCFDDSGSKAGKSFLAKFSESMHGAGSGGLSQVIHVFRASFDSLASGMDPWRVALQQIPQLFQALSLLGGNFLKVAERIIGFFTSLPVIIAGATIAVIGLLISAVSEYAQQQRVLRDLVSDTTNRFMDEVEAMKKLADAARDFKRWLGELGASHIDLMEKTDAAIAHTERLAQAHRDLVDAQTSGKVMDIDILEKTGAIGHVESVKRRTQIEKDAIKEKSDFELKTQKEVKDKLEADYLASLETLKTKRAAAEKAEGALNSPDAKARATKLNAEERKAKMFEDIVSAMEANVAAGTHENASPFSPKMTGKSFQDVTVNGATFSGSLDNFKILAQQKIDSVEKLKNQMSPAEIAAAKAKSEADEVGSGSESLRKRFNKESSAYKDNLSNAPGQVAAQQALLEKRAKLDSITKLENNHGATDWERAGGFGGGPFVALTNLTEQQLKESRAQTQIQKDTLAAIQKQKDAAPNAGKRVNYGGTR